jgi:hypothetical protein
MTDAFTVTATLAVPQVSTQLQLPIEAPSAQFQNTSSTASVTINAEGPALLDPPTGTVLTPGQTATVALQASNGGLLIASAIATGPGATVLVTMERDTLTIGGMTIEAPGPGQD